MGSAPGDHRKRRKSAHSLGSIRANFLIRSGGSDRPLSRGAGFAPLHRYVTVPTSTAMTNDPTNAERQARFRDRQKAKLDHTAELEAEVEHLRARVDELETDAILASDLPPVEKVIALLSRFPLDTRRAVFLDAHKQGVIDDAMLRCVLYGDEPSAAVT